MCRLRAPPAVGVAGRTPSGADRTRAALAVHAALGAGWHYHDRACAPDERPRPRRFRGATSVAPSEPRTIGSPPRRRRRRQAVRPDGRIHRRAEGPRCRSGASLSVSRWNRSAIASISSGRRPGSTTRTSTSRRSEGDRERMSDSQGPCADSESSTPQMIEPSSEPSDLLLRLGSSFVWLDRGGYRVMPPTRTTRGPHGATVCVTPPVRSTEMGSSRSANGGFARWPRSFTCAT